MSKQFKPSQAQPDKPKYQKFYVKGMHCASCEVLINKELSKLQCVDKVDVSLPDNCVKIYSAGNKYPTTTTLNNSMRDLGYTFHSERPATKPLTQSDAVKVVAVFAIFLAAFFLLEKSSFLARFTVTPTSSVYAYFAFGLLAGISSCAALVGGLLLSLSTQWNNLYGGNEKKSWIPFIYFNSSRVLAFAVFGGILGLIGSAFKISLTFSSLLSVGIALLMLAIGFQMLGVSWFKKVKLSLPTGIARYTSDETNFKGKFMPFLVGALTFFMPCGFTLIAQSNALASGSITNGALMLTLFALGTLPILALISFTSVKLHSNPTFSKRFNLFAGMLIVFFAFYTLNSQLNVLGLPSLNDIKLPAKSSKTVQSQASPKEEKLPAVQVMQMVADGFQYTPREITIKSGVKTSWQIYNQGAVGCAQAVYARGLYDKVIYLKPGLNTVEFTPTKKGTYKISCSMGMVAPVIVRVK